MALRPRVSGPVLVRLVLAGACVVLGAADARSQSLDPSWWVTDGTVNSVARDGSSLYVGGTFSAVAPATGNGVPFDAATGMPVEPYPQVLPGILGAVQVAIPDGAGGWYIGGGFDRVGAFARSGLARITASGLVAAWGPAQDGLVTSLALSGGTVYIGGYFTSVGGQPRANLAAVSAANGALQAWNPGADDIVESIAVSGGVVYAAGYFTAAGGQARAYVAALDATTGAATSWNPGPDAPVLTVAVDGGLAYLGGVFENVGVTARSSLAAVDASTGAVSAWDPSVRNGPFPGEVATLALDGATLYLGGEFDDVGGTPRTCLAAVSTATGVPTTWNPGFDGVRINTLAVGAGAVYAGGKFTGIGGELRSCLAALDPATGGALAWNPAPRGEVSTVSISGGVVYAGGLFTCAGGVERANLAALDVVTGVATAWNPITNGTVKALAAGGGVIYAGGAFTTVNGLPRARLAAIDAATGAVSAWNPNPTSTCGTPTIETLDVDAGTVFVGGGFTKIGGQFRNSIAAINPATGLATAWNPNPNPCSLVNVLVVDGGTAWVGGNFTSIGGQFRNRIAAIDPATGLATAWNPGADGSVLALLPIDGTIYAGGAFTSLGGQPRNRIAAIDATTGVVSAFDPNANSTIRAVASNAGFLYVGGFFNAIAGQARQGMASFEIESGALAVWDPGADAYVYALVAEGSTLYASGTFHRMNGKSCTGIAKLSCPFTTVYYRDADGDHHGNPALPVVSCEATPPAGYAAVGDDCNDSNPSIYPGHPEICNATDDDCDGFVNEGLACFTSTAVGLTGVFNSAVAWGDCDNDGDLDVVITGVRSNNTTAAAIYKNSGGANPTFTAIGALLTPVTGGSVAWGDYDGDGDLDLLLAGQGPSGTRVTKIYRNDGGTGPTFLEVNYGLTGVEASSVAWGDYDNDGDLDILLAGFSTVEGPFATVYQRTGGVFLPAVNTLTDVYGGSAAWVDYDGDGYLDILLTGLDATNTPSSRLYRNSGTAPPTFSIATVPITQVFNSSVAVGDYDNDANLDLLLAGRTSTGNFASTTSVYHNTGTSIPPYFPDLAVELPALSSPSVAWGDCHNDGLLDIALSGVWQPAGTPIAKVYRNTGTNFVENESMPPTIAYGQVAWADYDNDADLDLLLTGTTNGGPSGASALIARNATSINKNTPPATPTNLHPRLVSGTTVEFSWGASSDAQTPAAGLSYNLRIGLTPNGSQVCSPMSHPTIGYRRIPAIGNAGPRLSRTITLPSPIPTYYWSVQAIDGAFAGSPFAPEQTLNVALLSVGDRDAPPTEFAIHGGVPNPFRERTTLSYDLPRSTPVRLEIFDVTGRRVRALVAEEQDAGRRHVTWDGADDAGRSLPAGVYLYRLHAGSFSATRRLLRVP